MGLKQTRNASPTFVAAKYASAAISKHDLVMMDSNRLARTAAALASNVGCFAWAAEDAASTATTVICQEGEIKVTGVGLAQGEVQDIAYASDGNTVSNTQGTNEPIAGLITEYISATSGWLMVSRLTLRACT